MKIILITIFLGLLSSCATPYQPKGTAGGYSDMRLGKDLYQVSFHGNGYTQNGVVQEFFLRRCADLTVENGYDYFALVNQEVESNQQNLGSTYNGNVSRSFSGGYNFSGRSNNMIVTKHSRTGVIKLFNEGSQPPMAFEAREILKNFVGK